MAEVLALGIRQGRGRGAVSEGYQIKGCIYEKQRVDYSLLNNCGLLSQTAWVQITAVP